MTGEACNWLPPLVLFEDHEGDWDRYLQVIYDFFSSDFVHNPPKTFQGKRVGLKKYPLTDGKEGTFWHLITEGEVEADREVDIRRCERIRWPRPVMEGIGLDSVVCWVSKKKTKSKRATRIHLAVSDFSYVFVLDDRGEFVLPWTAYYVDKPHRRRKLERDWRAYHKAQKAKAASA